jgi:hypothetical protein
VEARLPEDPVTLALTVPRVAVLDAVSVITLVPVVVVDGLNVAVTPTGRLRACSSTPPVKPPDGVTVTVLVSVAPRAMLIVPGETVTAKPGVPALDDTVRATVAVCVRLPETPVTEMLVDPTAAVLEAVNVSVLDPVVLAGLKDAVTPLGRPLAERATAPVKPPDGVTVIALPAVAPCATLTLLGEAERV